MSVQEPLVSIVVITYNSAEFVLETLESAYKQTYENIELIITDDGSQDKTIELCREWLETKKSRFKRVELLTVEKNTGIAPNCNRGVKASHGTWIKLIAGDDILFDNCIDININYVNSNSNILILFTEIVLFNQLNEPFCKLEKFPLERHLKFFELDAAYQHQELIKDNFIWLAPSSFINTAVFLKVGTFEEKYPMMEDYPFWLKITGNGIKIYFHSIATVGYRQSTSTSKNIKGKWLNEKYFYSRFYFFKSEIRSDLFKLNKLKYVRVNYLFMKQLVLVEVFWNRKSFFSKIFNRVF